MTPLQLTTFYLSASAVTVRVAALSREVDRRHALQLAVTLLGTCAAANATWITRNWWTWPMMDSGVAWLVAVRYRRDPRAWKLFILLAIVAKTGAHCRWTLGDKFGGSAYAYHLTLNLLFLSQLGALNWTGSYRARGRIRRVVGGWFSGGSRGRAYLLSRAERGGLDHRKGPQ